MFLFTIRFDATVRRVKIRETFLLLMLWCTAHIWCYTASPQTVHSLSFCRVTATLSIVNTVELLVADAVGSKLQGLVKFQQFSPQCKYRQFRSKLMCLLKGKVSLLLIKLLARNRELFQYE